MRPASLLGAGLNHATARFDGADQVISLFERMGDGLLDVKVLAGRDRVGDHFRVPVVGSANDYGVDALVVEDRAIVAHLLHVFKIGFGRRALQMRLINVADGDEFSVGLILMNLNEPAATPADADRAKADAVVRPQDFAARKTAQG